MAEPRFFPAGSDTVLVYVNGDPVVVLTGASFLSDAAITVAPPKHRIEFGPDGAARNASPPQKPRVFEP